MAAGDRISATDYNNIRTKIADVLGTGSGSFGYGQPLQSSAVTTGQIVSKEEYDNLRYDLYNALYHQTGSAPSITIASLGGVITYGASNPVFQYDTLADTARTNRFTVGTGQFITTTSTGTSGVDFRSKTITWSSSVSCVATVTFANSDQARYFYNSGGRTIFRLSRTGTQVTLQDGSWTSFLNGLGNVQFGGSTTYDARFTKTFYELTSSYQTVFSQNASSPYGANRLTIQAKCDIANNSSGGARIIDFLIQFVDGYTNPPNVPENPPPGDSVTGTLNVYIDELKADGTLQPAPTAGNFTISSPSSYSITDITGS
jgi:hypothetical protein